MTNDRRPRSVRRPIIVVTVLAVVAVATWQLLARSALADVAVLPGSMQCDGKDVPGNIVEDSFGDEPPAPTFRPPMTPASECFITVVIANNGPRPVHLSSVTFDAMMPGETGRFLLETPRTDAMEEPREVDQTGDAIFDTDATIEPGSWIDRTYEIHYRDDGPTCVGATLGHSSFPTARVSTMGVGRDVVGTVKLVHEAVPTKGNRGCR